MVLILKPTKIKFELMSNEIEQIIDELNRIPQNMFEYFNYKKLIEKLNKVLEEDRFPKKKKRTVEVRKR